MLERQLVFEDFKDYVGSAFAWCDSGVPGFALTLDEATPLPVPSALPDMRPPFSLMFVGATEHFLRQGLYRLHHERLGEVAIFLVPVAKDARGYSYQALFN